MAATRDEAVVLRKLDYSETSQVLLFLTRAHGPRRLIAKGVKRGTKNRFAPAIDLLERGWVVFLGRPQGEPRLGTLTEWRQTDPFLGLREDLNRLYAAQYAAEATAAMTEDADPHPELFDALVRLLGHLCACEDPRPLLAGYQRSLLRAAGLWPDLTRCVQCDRPAPLGRAGYFAPHQGGLFCRQCAPAIAEKRLVPAAVLDALRDDRLLDGLSPDRRGTGVATVASAWGASGSGQVVSHTSPDSSPPASVAADAFAVLDYTLSHTLGRPLATARFILNPRAPSDEAGHRRKG